MSYSQPKTVELWLRSFTPCGTAGNHDRAVQLADRLGSRREIREVRVELWGDAFDRSGRTPDVPALERIGERLTAFEAWAAETGRRLDPFFRTRRVESTITGETRTICRLPTLAVAEYRGEQLVHVTPSRHGDRTTGPVERLEALLEDAGDSTPRGSDIEYDDADAVPGRRRVEHPQWPGETTM